MIRYIFLLPFFYSFPLKSIKIFLCGHGGILALVVGVLHEDVVHHPDG